MVPTATLVTIALMLCPPPICGSTVGEVSNQYGVTSVKRHPVRSWVQSGLLQKSAQASAYQYENKLSACDHIISLAEYDKAKQENFV